MILVLWLARLLDRTAWHSGRAANAVYRVHFRHENRKAARVAVIRAREQQKRVDAAITDLIGSTLPVRRVGPPIHRDR